MEAPMGMHALLTREIDLDPRARLLGFVPLACWGFQFVHHASTLAQPAGLWWIGHVATLLLAVGLFASVASVARAAALWSIVGLPLWVADVVLHGYASRVALLAGVAVPIAAAVALSQVKVGRVTHLVAHAMALFLVVQLLARLATPAALNINLAHKAYDAVDLGRGFPAWWALTTTLLAFVLALVALIARKLLPAPIIERPKPVDAAPAPPAAEPGFNLAPRTSPGGARDHDDDAPAPGFKLAQKISPAEYRAAIAEGRAAGPPPAQAPRPQPPQGGLPRTRTRGGGLVVERPKDKR